MKKFWNLLGPVLLVIISAIRLQASTTRDLAKCTALPTLCDIHCTQFLINNVKSCESNDGNSRYCQGQCQTVQCVGPSQYCGQVFPRFIATTNTRDAQCLPAGNGTCGFNSQNCYCGPPDPQQKK